MKHLKLFETLAQYEQFKDSEDYILPNVSYTEDGNLFYNPFNNEPTSTYTMVDLGLPSGLKWANMNVGATSPEDCGLYFQWGDTVGYTLDQVENKVKDFSDWRTYIDTDEVTITIEKDEDPDTGEVYGEYEIVTPTFKKYADDKLTILEASDDAATVHMGGNWRMPTGDELLELLINTTPTYIDYDGVEHSMEPWNGYALGFRWSVVQSAKYFKFTGSNGNSICIPNVKYHAEDAYYPNFLWMSNLVSSFYEHEDDASEYASTFSGYYDGLMCRDIERNNVIPIRGVCNK